MWCLNCRIEGNGADENTFIMPIAGDMCRFTDLFGNFELN